MALHRLQHHCDAQAAALRGTLPSGGQASNDPSTIPDNRAGSRQAPLSSRRGGSGGSTDGKKYAVPHRNLPPQPGRAWCSPRGGPESEVSDPSVNHDRLACFPPDRPWEASGLVQPPWSGTRANRDYPTKQRVVQRQQQYQDMLDHQVVVKESKQKRIEEDERKIDSATGRSLATRTHEWGAEPTDPVLEKAVFHEQVATVEHRRSRNKQRKALETEEFLRWRDASDRVTAKQWQASLQRRHQEKEVLAAAWRGAAEERRARDEEGRSRDTEWERAAVGRLVDGMLPPRRMRRRPNNVECGLATNVQMRAMMAQ